MDNNNDNDDAMNNGSNDSSSALIAEAVLSPPAQQHQPGNASALYKLAARNLREYHGVPSLTALKLEKTVALLGLPPRRIVVQGLAPRRLLKDAQGGSSPLVLPGEISDEGKEELRKAETVSVMDASGDNLTNSDDSSSEDEEEEDCIDNIGDYCGGDSKGDVEGFEADGNSYGKARRPIHAALVAGGIKLRPRETRPLLRALGVSPHRLVKLGLVERDALRARPGGRGGGPHQHPRTAGKRGVRGPRGPPRGPHHALGGPSSGCGPSRPMHGPPRHHFHGVGHHTMHLEESEEEGMSPRLGPHEGPGHHGPRHGHSHLPHGHGRRHPPHGHGHGHGHDGGGLHGERGEEGGERLHGGAGGPGQHGPRKHGHGHRHPPHGHGHSPHGHGHDGGGLRGESEEEGGERLHGGAGGPGQHGPRHHEGGGMGRSRGHPHGPPHGLPHGPFHGLFREGASGASPGMMAQPHHCSPSRGGGGMEQRGGRHGGGMGFCGGDGRGGGGGGGDMQHRRMAHLAHFDGRHQSQPEAY